MITKQVSPGLWIIILTTLIPLLKKGYFPKELPPPFMTTSYGDFLGDPNNVPAAYGGKIPTGQTSGHNLARAGKLRRQLNIPNPVHFFKLAEAIEQNWNAIETHNQQSPISKSIPTVKPKSHRAILPTFDFEDLPGFRARTRATSRYILKTDIANHYPSIYTHSISWAAHSKGVAKANRRKLSYWGNLLDVVVARGQDDQTGGIPIGPDTSLVLSEIVLVAIDRDFQNVRPLNGFRYMDDYEFGFNSLSEAEEALAELQSIVHRYDLQLNQSKTIIVPLPEAIESQWAAELRLFAFHKSAKTQRYEIVRFFNRAFELCSIYKNEAVLKYAISRLPIVNTANWPCVQDLLLQAAQAEPGVLPKVIVQLLRHQSAGHSIDTNMLATVFHQIMRTHAPLGHGSEVAWAIWGCICFSLQIDDSAASLLAQMEDSIVALLTLDARSRKLISNQPAFTGWTAIMDKDQLWQDQWLLCYEANIKGWLPISGADYVSADSCFGPLKQNGVSFYDVDAPKVKPAMQTKPRITRIMEDSLGVAGRSKRDIRETSDMETIGYGD